MFAKERVEKICTMIEKKGAVTTSQLVKLFDVSIETVRRDLLEMEKCGLLTRVHGGAVKKGSMKPFHNLEKRNGEYSKEKKSLCKKAAEFIENGDSIFVDSGSTAILFAEAIRGIFSELTVVTHSLDVFNIISTDNGITPILCGGHIFKNENAFYGHLTLEMLDNMHFKKSFIFPTAVSIDGGICDYQKDLLRIQKKALEISDKVFILADSSKFEKNALLKLDAMNDNYTYITDSGLSDELVKLYKENGLTVEIGE